MSVRELLAVPWYIPADADTETIPEAIRERRYRCTASATSVLCNEKNETEGE